MLNINFTEDDLIILRICLEKCIIRNINMINQNPNYHMSKKLEEKLRLDNSKMHELISKISNI